MAGKRKGKEDERHLWPEMLRAIREIHPGWIVGENVPGIINWSGGLVFDEVQTDLEAEGYEVQPVILPAVSVNAPHRRDRVWFVAHSVNGGYRDNGWAGRKKDSVSQLNREAVCTRMPDGTNTWSSPYTRLLGQEVGQLNSMGIEQFCKESNAPDAERGCRKGQHIKRQGQGELGRCDCETIADTSSQGLEGIKVNGGVGRVGEERDKQPSRCFRTDWQDFPTVSPLCDRNDGLSDRLVSITFSKWRNESIKAMGNAIVPQVVLQIFKAIEQYDKQRKNQRTGGSQHEIKG